MTDPIPPTDRAWLKRQLLAWFRSHRRELPWRADREPYRIWISEVMLQQTQVATVVPYFERFIERFPDVHALAEAEEQEVLRFWEGLGYYRRARHMHQAAKDLVSQHQGVFPRDPEEALRLPGMGRYTVNAILSQAYDLRLPILEANSRRVLCRLFGFRDDPRTEPLHSRLWQSAEDILPARKHIGDFNQAVMELGALVCAPTRPKCEACPLRSKCEAKALGLQESIPMRAPRPERVPVREVALVIRRQGKLLMVQRSSGAPRWANMWELPHSELEPEEDHDTAARRLLRSLGLKGKLGAEVVTIRHGVTHFDITMVCLEVTEARGEVRAKEYQDHRWLTPAELSDYPVSSPQRRLAGLLQAPDAQPRLF